MRLLLRSAGILALALVLVCAPQSAKAQSGSQITAAQVRAVLPTLEKYVRDAMTKTGVPGVSVAVVFQDQVLYSNGFGVRENGKSDPVTEDTVFQLASLSKPIGATVIASLVSDNILSWDTEISDLDPAFQLHDAYPTSQVTVRDLYSHRSGLPGNAGNDLEELGFTRDEILHRLRVLPLGNRFRAAYAYSNFGMTEGGIAAVKPTGKTWEQVSKERLYVPLGMTHTTSLNADFLKETNVAKLHIKVDSKWTAKLIRQPDAQSPAGGVSSTAKDLAQWLKLQIGRGTFEGKQVIKEAAILETHNPVMYRGLHPLSGNPNFYALGWGTEYDNAGRTVWTHNGAFSTGARTIATIYPQDELGIVVLCNAFPTGLPEAVSDTFFDLVHYGKPLQDHLVPWEQAFESLLDVPAAQAIETYRTPPSPVQPALANEAYVGTYANDYLGTVYVTAGANGLVLQAGPNKMEFPLKHWNRDVFLSYPSAEIPDMPSPVTFTIGPDGKATQLYIEALDSNGQGTLMRAHLTDATKATLIATIEKYLQDNNLQGAVVSYNIPNEGTFTYANGKANLETGRARMFTDPFRIASITKTFTALAILILVDQNKLSLDDKLSKWYPDFPNADKITVQELLQMRAGISDAFDQELAQQYFDDPLLHITADQMIARAAAKKVAFVEPNTETVYSNVNYSILERIVEKVSGKTLGEQISATILQPLNLTETMYPTDDKLPGELRGYSWLPDTKKYADKTVLDPTLAGGAGAIISTVADLQTYVRALCQGTLLKPATHAQQMNGITMKGQPMWVKYGEGVALFGKFCGHTGTIFGFSSDAFYLPDLDATIIINVNRLDLDDHSYSTPLQLALTKIVFPEYVNW